jgi:raffinose/stachyose/melibiose transport system substrate-binding protein
VLDRAEVGALSTDTVAQTTQDQKLQLLAGQGALPSAMIAPNTPSLVHQFIKDGDLVDVSKELGKAGLSDEILPAAASTIEKLYGEKDVYALPDEFNIEGIWYNKKIFAANGLSVPTTWNQLTDDMAKLKAAGVQPITADGKDGWPVTRWVGAYLFRSLGPDALQDVADGKAKLTDADYVKAADAVSDLGKKGYFGSNVASNDYNGTENDFMTGKAAMLYMGSWILSDFNDPSKNKIGTDAIGFMPFPAVSGGKGSIDQIPANVGQPIVVSKKAYDSGSAAWVKCIAKNYGDEVFQKSGVVSGFKLHKQHDAPALTKVVQDQMSQSKSSVLWFEALFSAKATTVSQSNGGLLGSGQLSGSDFMSKIQAANQ